MPRKTAYTVKKASKKAKNGFTWKKSGKSTSRIKVRNVLGSLLVLFLSLSFLSLLYFSKSLTKPFASASSISSSDLVTKEISTIVFVSATNVSSATPDIKRLVVLVYDKKDKKITNIELPINSVVDVPGKYGEEPISKILSLGVSVNEGDLEKGLLLLVDSIEKTFGFKMDSYVLVEESLDGLLLDVLTNGDLVSTVKLAKNVLNAGDNFNFKTNLNLSTLNAYSEFASEVSSDDHVNVTRTNLEVSDIDNTLNDVTFDSPVALERKSIAVLNGTTTSGLASYGSRVVKNLGGRVIATENTREAYEHSMLIVDSKDSETVKALVEYFKIDTVLLKSEANLIKDNEVSRSDVTLILGFDISKEL